MSDHVRLRRQRLPERSGLSAWRIRTGADLTDDSNEVRFKLVALRDDGERRTFAMTQALEGKTRMHIAQGEDRLMCAGLRAFGFLSNHDG